MEHGWVARVTRSDHAAPSIPRRRRFTLSEWLPSAIAARGGTVTRDSERAFGDLQAARDARESGR
jgi:hypothetical protein